MLPISRESGSFVKSAPLRAGARILCAVLMAAAALLCGCSLLRPAPTEDLPSMIHHAQERVFPTLVFLKPIRQELGSGGRVLQQVFGSGIIISPDGYVVTNSHVAKQTTEIKCVLFNSEELQARVAGLDEDTDLALVQIQLPPGHAPLPVGEFADSDAIHPGQFVMALGSPFGFTRSISLGIISCPRRYLELSPYNLWIQTDAAINPGNSGGPLVDARGQVVGISTLRASQGSGIGFAIPSNTVKRIIAQLRDKGRVERAYSGVVFLPLKDFIRDVILEGNRGALVGAVDEHSPAAAAGLKAGDLVLSLNGLDVLGTYLEDIPEVRNRFASLAPGVLAKMQIRRGEDILDLDLTPTRKQVLSSEGLELAEWNCSVQEISRFRTPGFAYFVPRGMYVLGARNPGNAYASGLRANDIILSINNQPIRSPENILEAYDRSKQLARGSRTALFEVLRGGYRQFIVLDFNRDYEQKLD